MKGDLSKMLLCSYSFGIKKNSISPEVLKLFHSGINENGEMMQLNNAGIILQNGMEGGINLNRSFNLRGYDITVDQNTEMAKQKEKTKMVFLFDDSNDFESNVEDERAGGLSYNDLYSKMKSVSEIEDAFEKVIDEEEVRFAIEQITLLRDDILAEEQVDVIDCIRQALKQVPSAVKRLKELCNDYELFGEMVEIVLGSGKMFNECFE